MKSKLQITAIDWPYAIHRKVRREKSVVVDALYARYSRPQMNRHILIDQRSLALGRAVAARVAEHPELIDQARTTLVRWMQTCSPRARSTLQEWLDILNGPTEGVIAVLTADNETATRLRQSSPFAGVLPRDQRNAILLQFESNDPATA